MNLNRGKGRGVASQCEADCTVRLPFCTVENAINGYLTTGHCLGSLLTLLLLLSARPAVAGAGEPLQQGDAGQVVDDGLKESSVELVFWPPAVSYQQASQSGFLSDSPQQSQAQADSFAIGFRSTLGFLPEPHFGIGIASGIQAVTVGAVTLVDFEIEPFLKANFGKILDAGQVNPFLRIGPSIGMMWGGWPLVVAFRASLELDPGVEIFLTRTWGIVASVPLSLASTTGFLCCQYNTVNVGAALGIFFYY